MQGTAPTGKPRWVVTWQLGTAALLERLVWDGVIKEYAEIARMTGLTRARVCQISNLTLLAPALEEHLLLDNTFLASEREMRQLVSTADWSRQPRAQEILFRMSPR